ncbi:MAG TPA: hypothetical protein VNY82_12590 [Steroidobacteraceae bacterium]|nr:hypothetical protein [Steroidobacteraceae bacterium]
MGCVPVNVPPMVLDVVAVHVLALVDDHVSCNDRPKVTLVAWAGAVNATVGMGVGGGIGDMGAL